MIIKEKYVFKNMNNQIDEAVKVLNEGGIIIFPTDTAFGIGCRMDNVEAIEKLFKIRNRPITQPTPVQVNGLEMVKEYVTKIPENVIQKLIKPYWPGALTIVLNAKIDKVPVLVRGGSETIGVRMSNHALMLEIVNKTGVPIVAPSANFHGESTPYNLKDLNPALVKLVDYVIDGICPVQQLSTVIDCTKKPWEILRQGAIQVKI
jgi:L-threonylcarbamoyladenylate synthase